MNESSNKIMTVIYKEGDPLLFLTHHLEVTSDL